MKIRILLVAILVLSSTSLNFSANAQSIDNCRIATSKSQQVSLGFPFSQERLSNILNPKILVIPYSLKREKSFELSSKDKDLFYVASDHIYNLSSQISRVSYIFNPVIDIDFTVEDMRSLKVNNNNINANNGKTWQERYAETTSGFIKKLITDQDKTIDYSGFDAVIFVNNSYDFQTEFAEAWMYSKNPFNPWFTPLPTAEGPINNIIHLYNRLDQSTLTHELMHLYGLTDLYGSSSSPPGDLMADSTIGLLAWQQWVLGWLPDQNVQCISERIDLKQNSIENSFSIEYSRADQILAIPTSTTTALIVDVVKRANQRWLYLICQWKP